MDALYYNGFKLAYRRYGAAAPVNSSSDYLSLGMSSAAWPTSLIAHLVREGFQVITPDNRDCGESSRCTDMKADGRNVASAVAQALLRRKVTSAYALEDMALDVERLGRLHLELAESAGERELLVYLARAVPEYDVKAPRRVLERCHYRHADPMPLSGGVHKGNIVLLTRFPERQATAAGIERAVQFLSGVMDTVAKA